MKTTTNDLKSIVDFQAFTRQHLGLQKNDIPQLQRQEASPVALAYR